MKGTNRQTCRNLHAVSGAGVQKRKGLNLKNSNMTHLMATRHIDWVKGCGRSTYLDTDLGVGETEIRELNRLTGKTNKGDME